MPTLARRTWTPWLVAGVVLAVAVGVVALVGGFSPAEVRRAASVSAGTPVETKNWRLSVEDAVWTDLRVTGTPLDEPVLRLHVQLTNISDHTRTTPRRGVLVVTVDGHPSDDVDWLASPDRALGFDPQVPREAWVEVPVSHEPSSVLVTVYTERESWSYADARTTEALGDVVASVELAVRDERGQP